MKIIANLYFLILKLRYKFNVKWFEKIDSKKQYIVFPNHQALVDPQIVFSLIWRKISLSPVVTETFYNMPVLNILFKMIWAVSMWDVSKWISGLKEINEAFKNIELWLNEWKNILLYPAWQLYSQWYEVIKWKKRAYNLVSKIKDKENIDIIVIKTTGLWWSHWSKAWNWETPNFAITLIKSIFILIWNILLLTPKREVNIEIENYSEKLKNIDDINEFNQILEDFYNKDWKEDIKYKKHFFYYNNTANKEIPKISGSIENLNIIDEKLISDEIKNKIIEKVIQMKEISNKNLWLNTNLITDTYFDSLDMAEIKSFIQINFSMSSNPPISELKTIWDLAYMAIWKSATNEELKSCMWTEKQEEKTIERIISENKEILWENTNILSLFKKIFSQNKNDSFVYDTIFWLQSKKDFLIKAYLISSYIKKIDWKYIWIMLPSVSSASLIIISTYLAWKIPVMLNWTVWETALLHCVKFANINNILTSKNFYEKAKNDWTEKIKDKYIFLEELLKNVSISSKLKALINSIFFCIPKIKYTDTAVLLFTSGSESLPKAVSLTHKNLITDIVWALHHFPITNKDKLIWFLPPFHSFWFTINTIMPLISWLNIAYTPDPNDSKTISNLIKHCNITTLTATPTFLKMILQVAIKDDLKSLKYAVVWAEKCPETLAENFKNYCPNWKILEWYWITECSPVISINPPNNPKLWSVWLAIYGSKIKILSLENKSELEIWKEWMIYYKWDNIFSWYLDDNLESPFDDINWELYYKTWDLWYLDNDWYLYITWRLKRFIKIAWEMISLPFIEWILNKKYGSDTELKLAIEALEEKWNVKIVLFWVDDLNLDEVSSYLRESWVSNLVKISQIIKLDSIPVLWTWKTDYKILKGMINF